MDKHRFLKIVQDYTATTVEDAELIASLRAQFPYSQVLHTLTARASRDHGLHNQQAALQTAAVYAADRTLLKEIIMRQPVETVQQVVSHSADANARVEKTLDEVDVADVVMDDLERLSRLKDTFEHLFMAPPETTPSPEKAPPPVSAPTPASKETPHEDGSPIKSKKERIIEMAKAMNSATAAPEAPKKKQKTANPVDELIAEIQSSKEALSPESDAQKQQLQIIEQFIAVQPSISNPRDRMAAAIGDLMPIKTGEFGDNIVSETLAEILIKQGKKEKAIEVLKKLIWKYPQKKAYFASQIENLKK